MPPILPRCLFTALLVALAACGRPAIADAIPLVDLEQVSIADKPMPRFKVDPDWPKLPKTMVVGQVSGISIDKAGNIWIVQRRDTVRNVPEGKIPAPHVLKFAPDGTLLTSWGGPQHAPEIDGVNQWPANVHGLYVDDQNTVWIGGNGKDDHVVINLTSDGKYLGQIGRRGKTAGNQDVATLGGPADVFRDGDTVYVADGYTNKRVVAASASDKRFKQVWGAYGTMPTAPSRRGDFNQAMASSNADGGANAESRSFGDIVHCVAKDDDGNLFVCDRRNNRVQIFRRNEEGKMVFIRNLPVAVATGGLRTASDVTFSPDGRYIYIADMQNERVWTLDRSNYEYLGHFGKSGRAPGEFIWLHSIVTDKQGNLYTTEVNGGQRVQKFTFQGVN